MKNTLLLLLFLSSAFGKYSFAGGDNFAAGARASALGGASVTLTDVFSTTNNQAGLAFMDKFSVGIYSDRKFLNAVVNNFNLAIAAPFKKVGTFGLSSNYYGYKLYNETKIGVAYSRLFGNKFSVGVQFDYLRLSIAENGNRNFYTIEFGLLYKPWKKFWLGAHVYNPIPYKVEKVFDERLPTIIKFGLGYVPSEKVILCAEYEQDIHYKPRFKTGIEYRPIKYFHVRAGGQSTPFAASFGTGINVAGLNIDLATSFHPVLGFTPQAALIYSFKKKDKNEKQVK
jgi:hypothetical protein